MICLALFYRNKMKSIILLSVSLILCGCTTSQDEVAAESSNIETEVVRSASGYKCEQEIITGTKFKKKRCRTSEQIKRDEAQAKEMLRSQRSSAGSQND